MATAIRLPRRPPDFPARLMPLIVLGALVLWLVYSSVYTVPAESVGVVQRFGRYFKDVNPDFTSRFPTAWMLSR